MEDLQLALTTARVDQRNFGLWINSWQIGQSLNALVTNQLPTGELVLRVGGQQVTATSDIPIQQGAQLLLEVKQLQPVPTLRVLNLPEGAANLTGANATLRLMPAFPADGATQPIANLLQALQTAQTQQSLPPPVTAAIDELLRLSSRPERLTNPDGLSRAVRDSGVFMEAKLAAAENPGRGATAQDLKAGILRTLGRTNAALAGVEQAVLNKADAESLGELKRELESSLGRMNLNQVASQGGEASARSWQVEIPVQYGNAFHSLAMHIERDGAQESRRGDRDEESDEETPWRVRLDLEPPALGPIEVDLRIGEKRLRLGLAAQRPETRQLLDTALGLLEAGLATRGVTLEAAPARELSLASEGALESEPLHALDLHA